MAYANTVRTTRSGDRFHYLWASLRALRLLDWTSDLQAVSVEGPVEGEDVPGEEIIDVAEYFGTAESESARRVHYHQLKHSSVRVDDPITSSELSKTLGKFAEIYRDVVTNGHETAVDFSLVTNRVLGDKVRQTLSELAAGQALSHQIEGQQIRKALGFGADSAGEQGFCQRLTVEDGTVGVVDVERILADELKDFIPGGGTGAELAELMHQVSGMATYEAKTNTLNRHDLLVTLRTTEEQLFPAMPDFEDLDHVIRTADVDDVAAALRSGTETKLLLTAHGGVGKSIFTGMLKDELATDSITLVFDCFAGGNYRRITSRRHLHRIALTQLANELASKGLCTALVPSQSADPGDYVRAFESKIRRACERLATDRPDAFLTLVIDAADNAVMAASEFGERPFVADLFCVDWPANLRLVALCRPERKALLNLPGGVREFSLSGFDLAQTLTHLRTRFPAATVAHAAQLHVLSTGNPRVQAMAMEGAQSADEAISALQIASNRPGDALDTLLADQVQKVATQGYLLPDELTELCQALATMHPTIPLIDLAKITNLSVDAIRSFAVALGRGLHCNKDDLQFRDEPTETWFRNNHSLNSAQMRDFASRVAPHAADSAYIAAVLPQLLFEAHMVDELVQLALSDGGLPAGVDDLQSQEIARARARFALGAALRASRNSDAALLAVKAGTLSSGRARRMKMFRANPDLAAMFLERDVIDSLCSGRELTVEWPGSNLHVEALMLSHLRERRDLSRTRFTSSYNTISAILRLDGEGKRQLQAQIGSDEVADLAFAKANLDGPRGVFEFLAGWRPHDFVREVTAKFASRLADAGRIDELSELIVLAGSRKHIQIGVIETMFEYGISPSDDGTRALAAMLAERRDPFKHERGRFVYDADLRGVSWALLHAVQIEAITDAEALRILDIHLVPLGNHVGERWHGLPPTGCLLGHALRARLAGTNLDIERVVNPEFFKLLSKESSIDGRDTRSFKQNIPQLLPWATCLVDAVLDGPAAPVQQAVSLLAAADFAHVHTYDTPFVRLNGYADFAIRILTLLPIDAVIAQFAGWHEASGDALTRSLQTVVRCAARNPALATVAIAAVNRGLKASQKDRSNADMRVDELIDLARAILATSATEARAIFNVADGEAKLVGDDLPARWYALTNTARRLGTGAEPQRAYRLLQIGETLDIDERSDVSQLAKPLFAMHPPSYYAAASRQRDRRALTFDRLLDPIMQSAASPSGRIGVLAVVALGAHVRWGSITEHLPAEEAARLDGIYSEFTRFERRAGDVPRERHSGSSFSTGKGHRKPKPAKVVARLDFTATGAWEVAFSQIDWYSDVRRKMVRRALRKVPAKLAESIRALADSAGAREDDFVVAARFASEQSSSVGVQESVSYLATVFADRFSSNIATRWYDRSELREFAQAAGVPVETLLKTGFVKLGERAHTLNHEEYFSLASHIARTLDVPEAAQVFDALAELFDDLAPPTSASDGPYDQIAAAPTDLATCLAGLIWSALGDMTAARRWEAAHAVLMLVRIGDLEALTELAKFADATNDPGPFHDARFARYDLHSRLWLLFALERSASEPTAVLLEPFVPWLIKLVDGPVHAANQVVAQKVLQNLSSGGVVEPTADWGDCLSRRLLAEWDEQDWEGQRARKDPFASDTDIGPDDGTHPFFFDFQSYWARHLADVFGTTEQAIAQKAGSIAKELTGYDDDESDPRRAAGVFNKNGSYPDHRSWPQEEDFTFYAAVHSLLTLAGHLGQTLRAFKEPESAHDQYTEWLNEFMPKRRDGRWLSDRRDAPPAPAPEKRIEGSSSELWRWSLSPQAFESVVGHGTDWVLVDADYETTLGDMSEEVSVSSALISHVTARAYLIALQTNALGGRNHFPKTDDDRDDDRAPVPFRLTPWINGSTFDESIDREDDRGRNVVFPPSRPGPHVVDRFGLSADEDYRVWGTGTDEVFRSQVWDDTVQAHREYRSGTTGQRLVVGSHFLTQVLTELDMTLVVQVNLRRDVHRSSYQRKEADDIGWVEWSTKVYLIGPDGRWTQY